jgi:broad specificity phosphatase PhoE
MDGIKRHTHFTGIPLAAVFSSPLERAVETATPLAAKQNLEVRIAPGLGEINYGRSNGKSVAEMQEELLWRSYNNFRSGTRIPGGR